MTWLLVLPAQDTEQCVIIVRASLLYSTTTDQPLHGARRHHLLNERNTNTHRTIYSDQLTRVYTLGDGLIN